MSYRKKAAIEWTPGALSDLESIAAHIAADSPPAAARLVEALVAQLEFFPESGAEVPEKPGIGLRQLVEGSYRIVYRHGSGTVQILAVIHGRRDAGPLIGSG